MDKRIKIINNALETVVDGPVFSRQWTRVLELLDEMFMAVASGEVLDPGTATNMVREALATGINEAMADE